jgi:hypothetical protein
LCTIEATLISDVLAIFVMWPSAEHLDHPSYELDCLTPCSRTPLLWKGECKADREVRMHVPHQIGPTECFDFQVLGPMAFRRRDVQSRLWRVCTHILQTHPPTTTPYTTAVYVIQTCLFPSTCLLTIQTPEWTLVWNALSCFRQVERCRLYYETGTLFGLEPRDKIIGKGKKVDLASRLAAAHGERIAHEIGQLQKKASLPKSGSTTQNKVC